LPGDQAPPGSMGSVGGGFLYRREFNLYMFLIGLMFHFLGRGGIFALLSLRCSANHSMNNFSIYALRHGNPLQRYQPGKRERERESERLSATVRSVGRWWMQPFSALLCLAALEFDCVRVCVCVCVCACVCVCVCVHTVATAEIILIV